MISSSLGILVAKMMTWAVIEMSRVFEELELRENFIHYFNVLTDNNR